MNSSSPDHSDGASPLRGAGVLTASGGTRQPTRMRQDGTRSSAVTPFNGLRTGALGAGSNNATINETDNIKVAVRVRPLFPDKVDKDAVSVLQVTEDHCAVKVVVPGPAGNKMQRDFQFHACLGPDVSQADVLQLCGVPQLLDAALSGYNVTIFAYGQTGSGKTYTMSGREEVIGRDGYQGDTHDGIITRSVNYLYQQIRERKDCKVQLSASYLEIYNEAVFDLLTARHASAAAGGAGAGSTGGLVGGRPAVPARDLGIKWDPAQGFFVPGLKVVHCKSIDSMMEVIRLGMKHRHVGSHQLNMESSRSHSIMTIHCSVVSTDESAWDFGTPRFGKICFVDLAGSERLKDSKSEGAMLKETTNINKSLFVLGKVISALAERDTAGVSSAHIPYRDSKLTKLLMDSLGGSALALMIACCSPSMNHVEETLSTLSYATRAKNIQNRPTVQYDPKEAQITALRREIELLRQENQYLREQIRLGGGSIPATPSTLAPSGLGLEYTSSGPGADQPGGVHARPDWPTLRGMATPGGALASALQRPPSSSSALQLVQVGAHYPPGGGQGADALNDSAMGVLEPPGSARGKLQLRASLNHQGAAQHHSLRQRASANPHHDGSAAGVDALSFVLGDEGGDDLVGGPGQLRAGSGTAWRPGGSGPSFTPQQPEDLATRLKETQSLLAKFSAENGRLAKENDRLRMHRVLMTSEHAGVLEEIEALRTQLSGLENSVLSGNASPGVVKALLSTLRPGGGAGSAVHSPTSSIPPSRDVTRTAASASLGGLQPSSLRASRATPLVSSWSRTSDELGMAPPPLASSSSSSQLHAPEVGAPPTSMTPPPLPSENSGAPDGEYFYAPAADQRSSADAVATLSGPQQPQQPQQQRQPHQPAEPNPRAGQGSSAGPRQQPHDQGGNGSRVADVLAVGGSGSAAVRSRQPAYGDGGGGTPKSKAEGGPAGAKAGDSIIIADKAKLALLLGTG